MADDLVLPLDAVTQTFALLGVRGSGKTHCAVVLVEQLVRAGQSITVLDPLGVWWGLRASADGKSAGLPTIIAGGDHGDVPLEPGSGAVMADFVVDSRQPVVLDVSTFRKAEQHRFVTDFGERLFRRNKEPLHLVLDEADSFAPQRPMHGQERMLGAVEDLVRRGRARGIGVTLVTQRSAVLNKNVLSQAETLIALRTVSPQDRAAVDAWIEHHGDRERRSLVLGSLPELGRGEAWVWSPGWLGILKRVKIAPRTTFDSSATPKVGEVRRAPKTLAPVDLAALRERLAATIERAKQEDPAQLRRRIAELEKAASARAAVVASAPVVRDRPVPVVDAEVVARATRTVEKLAALYEKIGNDLGTARITLEYLAEAERWKCSLQENAARRGGSPARDRVLRRRRPWQPTAKEIATAARDEEESVRSREEGWALEREGGNGALVAGERRMLAALAEHSAGLTAAQLGTLAGIAPTQGTFRNYRAKLVRSGYIELRDGRMRATTNGRAAVGNVPPAPTDTASLVARWNAKLVAGERRLLESAVAAYPEGLDADAIRDVVQIAPDQGTFRNYRAHLRRCGLIDLRDGLVYASASLFHVGGQQ